MEQKWRQTAPKPGNLLEIGVHPGQYRGQQAESCLGGHLPGSDGDFGALEAVMTASDTAAYTGGADGGGGASGGGSSGAG